MLGTGRRLVNGHHRHFFLSTQPLGMRGLSALTGIEPTPLHWKCRVLMAGPSGKPPRATSYCALDILFLKSGSVISDKNDVHMLTPAVCHQKAAGAFSLPCCGLGSRTPTGMHLLASKACVLCTKCFLGARAEANFFFICVFSRLLKAD